MGIKKEQNVIKCYRMLYYLCDIMYDVKNADGGSGKDDTVPGKIYLINRRRGRRYNKHKKEKNKKLPIFTDF